MSLVKGSKKYRIKIVEYRVRYVVMLVALVIAVLASSIAVTYFYGYKVGMSGQQQALADVSRLSVSLDEETRRANEYEQLLANTKMASEVDKQAGEDVRQQVIVLTDEIARLDEENTFYRGLMAPNESSSGLTLGAVELVNTRTEGTYTYKVIVQQLATRHNLLNGKCTFTVIGRQNGIETRYPLMVLSPSVSSEDITLRFKYFQVIQGELVLPEGFEPDGIEIEAKSTGKQPQTVSKKFGWLVEER